MKCQAQTAAFAPLNSTARQRVRKLPILAFLLCISASAQQPTAVAAVADVDLKFLRVTDLPAAYLCFDEEQQQCGVYAVYYLWEATLRQQNSGDALPKKFRVLFGTHALLKEDFRLFGAHIIRSNRLKTRNALYEITNVSDFEPMPDKPLKRTRGK